MNPQELSAYITSLLRSEPEVIASFFTGVVLTGMLVYALRRWVFHGRDSEIELARKDAEIARKDTELARKDAHIARVEANLAILDGKALKRVKLVRILPPENTPLPADSAAAQARCEQLEAENRELVQLKQALEQSIENLQTELTHVSGELAFWAKWSKRVDEENARLTERGSLAEG